MENDNTIRRLKTVEGHLRGVIRMVEEDAYCIDVIRQIQAVEAALAKVSLIVIDDFAISPSLPFIADTVPTPSKWKSVNYRAFDPSRLRKPPRR